MGRERFLIHPLLVLLALVVPAPAAAATAIMADVGTGNDVCGGATFKGIKCDGAGRVTGINLGKLQLSGTPSHHSLTSPPPRQHA
nr:unnamed protein product [Digitaria exilis]